jgi:hypothetical protein
MDEFLTAVKRRYGNTVLLQFEGMAYENASKLLNMYRFVNYNSSTMQVRSQLSQEMLWDSSHSCAIYRLLHTQHIFFSISRGTIRQDVMLRSTAQIRLYPVIKIS